MNARLDQLDAQQALLTHALARTLESRWTGAPPSVAADLMALNPDLEFDPRPPLPTSDAALEPSRVVWDPEEYMPRQTAEWTCSACALAWVLRATGLNPNAHEWGAVDEIGNPQHINPTWGLMDGSGSRLRHVLRNVYDTDSRQGWLSFDQVWAAAGETTGMMSGVSWYHWVAIRGQANGELRIANSAPGYMGAHSSLSRAQFNALGPFSVVLLEP